VPGIESRLLGRLACGSVDVPTELNSGPYCFYFVVSAQEREHIDICLLLAHGFPAVAPLRSDQPHWVSGCALMCSALTVISNTYETDGVLRHLRVDFSPKIRLITMYEYSRSCHVL
jgi:hypothetical protein